MFAAFSFAARAFSGCWIVGGLKAARSLHPFGCEAEAEEGGCEGFDAGFVTEPALTGSRGRAWLVLGDRTWLCLVMLAFAFPAGSVTATKFFADALGARSATGSALPLAIFLTLLVVSTDWTGTGAGA